MAIDQFPIVSIYNYKADLSDIDQKSLTHIFNLTKQNINEIRTSTRAFSDVGSCGNYDELEEIKTEITSFLRVFTKCFTGETVDDESILTFLLDNMKSLLLFAGRLTDLDDAIIEEALRDEDTPEFLLLEILFEIWFVAVETFFHAKKKDITPTEPQLIGDQTISSPFHLQAVQLLIADFMKISLYRFNKFPKTGDIETLRPFASNVFNKRLSKMKSLLDSQSTSFWSTVDAVAECFITETCDSNEYLQYFTLKMDKELQDPQVAILWLLTSYRKQLKCKNVSQSDILFAVGLINTVISKEDPSTVSPTLLTSLRLVKLSYQIWTDKVDLIIPYFDLTIKRLNKVDGLNLQAAAQNGKQWYDQSSKLLDNSDDFTRPDLFTMTLRTWCYVINHLVKEHKSAESDSNNEQMKLLKDKLLTKATVKRMNELSELGLYKLLTLFISFTSWASRDRWNEVVLVVIDLAIKQFESCPEHAKNKIFLKSLFALIYLTPPDGLWNKVIDFTSHVFKNSASSVIHPEVKIDSFKYKSILKILTVYFEEVRSFERSATEIVSKNSIIERISTEFNEVVYSLLEKVMYLDRENLIKVEPVFKLIASDIRDDNRRTVGDVILPAVKRFVERYLGSVPNTRVFKAIEVIVKEFPELTQGTETIFGIVNATISDIEARGKTGTDVDMRKQLNLMVKKFTK